MCGQRLAVGDDGWRACEFVKLLRFDAGLCDEVYVRKPDREFATTELGRAQQQALGRGVGGSSSRLCKGRLNLSTNDGRCPLTQTYGIACRNLWVCCLSCKYWRCCSCSSALEAARLSLLWICGLKVLALLNIALRIRDLSCLSETPRLPPHCSTKRSHCRKRITSLPPWDAHSRRSKIELPLKSTNQRSPCLWCLGGSWSRTVLQG